MKDGEVWSTDSKTRNKAQHAYNGNPRTPETIMPDTAVADDTVVSTSAGTVPEELDNFTAFAQPDVPEEPHVFLLQVSLS